MFLYGKRRTNIISSLNIFDLYLNDNLNIVDKNNKKVGSIIIEDSNTIIQCTTNLGKLYADYTIYHNIDNDYLLKYNNNINFKIDGPININGNMIVNSNIDLNNQKSCNVNIAINYIDNKNNESSIKLISNKSFIFESKNIEYNEQIIVNPWSIFDRFIYHSIKKGKFNSNLNSYYKENVNYIERDKNNAYLKTVTKLIDNYKIRKYENQLYHKVPDKELTKGTIQKGLLMQKIDKTYSKKIKELQKLFNKNKVLIFDNLISVTFDKTSPQEINHLFATEIEKIKYYNEEDNLTDAIFKNKKTQKRILK